MDIRRTPFPLRAPEALLAAVSDWLVFIIDLSTSAAQHWAVVWTGAGLAFVTCWLIEGEDGAGFTRARAGRALAAAAIVVVPSPLLGTLVAAAALSWSWMQSVLERRVH